MQQGFQSIFVCVSFLGCKIKQLLLYKVMVEIKVDEEDLRIFIFFFEFLYPYFYEQQGMRKNPNVKSVKMKD